jgi:hypothetical protein
MGRKFGHLYYYVVCTYKKVKAFLKSKKFDCCIPPRYSFIANLFDLSLNFRIFMRGMHPAHHENMNQRAKKNQGIIPPGSQDPPGGERQNCD